MNKQNLINYLEGELSYSHDDDGVAIYSFPESNIEQVADDIMKALEEI